MSVPTAIDFFAHNREFIGRNREINRRILGLGENPKNRALDDMEIPDSDYMVLP